MPKNKKIKPDLASTVMTKITSNQIKMKPRWYFVAGSGLLFASLVGLAGLLIFLVNLMIFILRCQGPMMNWKLQQILINFPSWIVVIIPLLFWLGLKLLKKYDFSYQLKFPVMVISIVTAIVLAAWLLDVWGLTELWSRQGPMRHFYQSLTKPAGRMNKRLFNQF